MFSLNGQILTNNDPYFNTPLTFIAAQPNSSIKITKYGTPAAAEHLKVGYYDDLTHDIDWLDYECETVITLQNVGDKIYFKNEIDTFSESQQNYFRFFTSGLFECDGNLQSLMNWRDDVPDYSFISLFRQCDIVNGPKLLGSTAGFQGYYVMFRNSKLVNMPIIKTTKYGEQACRRMFYQCPDIIDPGKLLPARDLGVRAFDGMFESAPLLSGTPRFSPKKVSSESCHYMFNKCYGLKDASNITVSCECAPSSFMALFQYCSSLILPCSLPTLKLAPSCYAYMFSNCHALIRPAELPATKLYDHCYQHMMASCSSMTYTPTLPALEVPSGAYAAMFKWCYGLTEMPDLPATKVEYASYYSMFCYDENITGYIDELPVLEPADECFGQMFYGNLKMTKAPKLKIKNVEPGTCQKMFWGCTSLTEAPELPITSLVTSIPYPEGQPPNVGDKVWGALEQMFYGCTSLSSITVHFTEWEPSGTINWVGNGVPGNGVFYAPEALSAEYGASRIPLGWSKEDI